MSGIDEGDKMSEVNGTPWKNEGYYTSYQEAVTAKTLLKGADKTSLLQFKIKRCGINGINYVVKSRIDQNALAELQQIEESLLTSKNKKSKK